MTDTQRDLLDRLADLARQIEAHHTAIFLLERQQLEVREQLIRAGWKPPVIGSAT